MKMGLAKQEQLGHVEAGHGACTVLAPCLAGVGIGLASDEIGRRPRPIKKSANATNSIGATA
jgi:hypothetical protein